MSVEAVTWALDRAPMPRTKAGKPDHVARHVLQALAEHARPDGTRAHPSVELLEFRTGIDGRTIQRCLRTLAEQGLITAAGMVRGCVVYNLALGKVRPPSDREQLKAKYEKRRLDAAARKRKSREKTRVTQSDSVTVTQADSVTVTHSNDVTEPAVTHPATGRHTLELRDVTQFATGRHTLNDTRTTNEPSLEPSKEPLSPGTPEEKPREGAAAASGESDFDAFWKAYPKRHDVEAARRSWTAALKRGADPAQIVRAAHAYAQDRAGQPERYTKLPTTWLDKGSYADERPQLRVIPGTQETPVPAQPPRSPYRNPIDAAVYHRGWGHA